MTIKFPKAVHHHAAVFICIIISSLAFILCIAVGKIFKDEVETQFRRETRNIAQILVSHFDSTVRNLDEMLLQIGSDYRFLEANSSDKPLLLHELLKRHAPHAMSEISVMSISDKGGMIIATSNEYPFSPITATSFVFHANDPANPALHISPPRFGRLSKQWIIRFSRPLKTKDGIFDGVVEISYKLSDFEKLFEKLDVKSRGVVSLTGRDGIIRMSSFGGKITYGITVPAQSPAFKMILSGINQGSFDAESVDGVRRIGYFVVSEVAPFHIYVGYDHSYLESQYHKIFVLLGISWSLFSLILMGSVFYIQRMERVRQQALSNSAEAVSAERTRILADMHDSIGASLAVLISHLNPIAPNWVELKRKATQILTELRLLVDSIETEHADLNDVLSSVRHRMHSGIELAGINIVWKVDHSPIILSLTPRDALALRLILMKALSNVLSHSSAKTVNFSVEHDEPARFITILIADDGCGFDVATAAKGIGLNNMQNRAKNMSVPTMVRINSAPGEGTRLTWSVLTEEQQSNVSGQGVNYDTVLLGRKGYFHVLLVTNAESFKMRRPEIATLLSTFEFNQGSRYTDFNSTTDSVANCSLDALLSACSSKK